jgi:hypothetical protein
MGTTTAISDVTGTLQGRARRLRQQAASQHPLLAAAYRRRAAELDLQAWLETVWNPPLDLRAIVAPQRGVTCTNHRRLTVSAS